MPGDLNTEKTILKRLLAVNTCNPPGNERGLIEVIRGLIGPKTGIQTVIAHDEKRASFTVEIPGKDTARKIAFLGHLDTVPTGDAAEWRHAPFACEEADGLLYGRGAADMRGGLAVMVSLIRDYAVTPPPVNLLFGFTADEESFGTGVRALRERGCFEDADALFVCEPTGGRLGVAEKGAVWLDFQVKGKTSHSSMPAQGVNAFELGVSFLLELKREVEGLPRHKLFGTSTCTVTRASAGIKTNMVPDSASFSVDIRVAPGTFTADGLITTVKKRAALFCRRHTGLQIGISCTNARDALEIAEDHPLIQTWCRCLHEADLPIEFAGIRFYTDASLVVPFHSVPFLIFGPGRQEDCHQIDESIDPDAVGQILKAYRTYLCSLNCKVRIHTFPKK